MALSITRALHRVTISDILIVERVGAHDRESTQSFEATSY
jgi:hypothetical protein